MSDDSQFDSLPLWERLPGKRVEARQIAAALPASVPGGYMAVCGAQKYVDEERYTWLTVETGSRYHGLLFDRDAEQWERVETLDTDEVDEHIERRAEAGLKEAAKRLGFQYGAEFEALVVACDERFDTLTEPTDDAGNYTPREYRKRDAHTYMMDEREFYDARRELVRQARHRFDVAPQAEVDGGEYVAVNHLPDVKLGRNTAVSVRPFAGDENTYAAVKGTVVQTPTDEGDALVLDDGEETYTIYEPTTDRPDSPSVDDVIERTVEDLGETLQKNLMAAAPVHPNARCDTNAAGRGGTTQGGTVEFENGSTIQTGGPPFDDSTATYEITEATMNVDSNDLETEAITEFIRRGAERAGRAANDADE